MSHPGVTGGQFGSAGAYEDNPPEKPVNRKLFPVCPGCKGPTRASHCGAHGDLAFVCIYMQGDHSCTETVIWLSRVLEGLKTFEEYRDLMVSVFRDLGR